MKHIKEYYKFNINESSKFKPNIKTHIIDGFTVLQGKDSNSNDYLTVEMSDPEDIWMHSKGVPGSHVLIKTNDRVPSLDIIKKAAEIAAKNCKSKENKVVVLYCKKKFVNKDSNMNPGQVKVDYKNSNEITIEK